MAVASVLTILSLSGPTLQLPENTWAIVVLADVTMTVAGTTVISAGTVIVTVTVIEARTVITMVATGIGVIAVVLLQRVAGTRPTTDAAGVIQGALPANAALSAVPTEEIMTHLVLIRLRRLRAGKGSESSKSMDLAAAHVSLLHSFSVGFSSVSHFCFYLTLLSTTFPYLRSGHCHFRSFSMHVKAGLRVQVVRTQKMDMRKSYIRKVIIRTRLKKRSVYPLKFCQSLSSFPSCLFPKSSTALFHQTSCQVSSCPPRRR